MFSRLMGFSLLMGGLFLGLVAPIASPALAATRTASSPAQAQLPSTRSIAHTCASYTVRSGDWLSTIATRYGLTWQTMYAQNRQVIGADPNRIAPGESLLICAGALMAAPAPTTAPPPSSGSLHGQPCQSPTFWPSGTLTTSRTPPGCYAAQYVLNPTNYPQVRATFGGCDWWPAAIHPQENIWTAARHTTPHVGASILFAKGEQGASSVTGHWGVVVAISANGRYILSSEMNMTIYGRAITPLGGWGKIVYRYIVNDPPRTQFVY